VGPDYGKKWYKIPPDGIGGSTLHLFQKQKNKSNLINKIVFFRIKNEGKGLRDTMMWKTTRSALTEK
jgi:hypothetical protein